MYAVWALARKEVLLLVRDRLAFALLIALPLVFVAVLGLILGENFGQNPRKELRVSLVDLDRGTGLQGKSWSYWVRQDLIETPGIQLEIIPTREQAEALIRDHRRSTVLVLNEDFSDRINQCSFLDTPGSLNPFHREGVHLDPRVVNLGLMMLRDETQQSSAAIIEQVVQVAMLRVVLPFMIGQAFQKLSEPAFIDRLGQAVRLPVPEDFPKLVKRGKSLALVLPKDLNDMLGKLDPLVSQDKIRLADLLELASGKDEAKAADYRGKVGEGVKEALAKQFNKYDLTGMTWAALTRSKGNGGKADVSEFVDREGSGLLRRGAHLYQTLVPMYTVLFAFFLVLIVGWVFVSERRQGTLKRLRLAPLTRGQIILGKLLPCYVVSVGQGALLLLLGRLLFGMRWGPDHWPLLWQVGWLLVVVLSTSLAAMGLAMLVASLARTEMQVELFGGVPVLVLAVIGGCVLPREMMPEQTQWLSLLTPHGWALNAYRELLAATPGYEPNLGLVLRACGVLAGFGAAFLAAAWWLLRLE